MNFDTWLLFLFTSVGLSLAPGPNSLLVLTHGALHGVRRTLFTIVGGLFGFVIVIALCMFGIGALVKSSLLWLLALKWLGGLYLAWLGIKLWRAPPLGDGLVRATTLTRAGPLLREGFLTAATNPKTLLFFTALLPQFIDPARNLMAQFAAVAATFAMTECLTELALASAATRIRPWLARVGRTFNRVCGTLFIALGAALPLRA